jgi:RNA polymerase sigma-70 factor (ECF subfamily)
MRAIMPDETRARDLVERARNGDPQAFADLFEPLRQHLLATIGRRLSPAIRQRIDPEDVLQDTFVRGLHSLSRFEWQGDDSFRRWLEAIATHVTLDVVRHQGRREAIRIDRDLKGDDAPPSRAMRRKERRERLQNSLRKLSPDHRTVLELSRMEGLSIRAIAERMGRTESAVKNLLLRATRKLRESFGDTDSLGLDDGSSQQRGIGDGP